MKYGDEVVIINGPFRGKRGTFDSSEGAECKIVMYAPVYGVLMFERWELEAAKDYDAR